MKINTIILLIILAISGLGRAQIVDASFELSQINFHNLQSSNAHNQIRGDGNGQIFRIGIDSIGKAMNTFRCELGVRIENADMSLRTGGQGGAFTYETSFKKRTFFVALYPVNLQFAKYFKFSLGAQGHIFLTNNYQSHHTTFLVNGFYNSYSESGKTNEIHSAAFFSLAARPSVLIPIGKRWSILGLVTYTRNNKNEFDGLLDVSARSFSAGLGVSWKLDR